MSHIATAELFVEEDAKLYAVFFQDESYEAMLQERQSGKKIFFNGYAFFFGIFWFVYRKMYVEALVVLVVSVGMSFIDDAVLSLLDEDMHIVYNFGSMVMIGSTLGLVANPFYFRRAERIVRKAKSECPDFIQQMTYLKRRGGTSNILYILLGVLVIACFIYFNFIARP